MARITLRDYNREIEEMVDSGRVEEAIAHCRYVLEQYPKHILPYRSLGKALLEAQRYGDAADIFIRVLSSIPDDFISHLGMGIIREDEGDLDGAIWHMERAFEVQPSNAAVQAELRRLYGRRDGLAPNKVQLTRGAMARMSAKSNLYTQAIAELRTALADDPNRPDLQVLLARMYSLAGQRMAAIETSSALLGKYPYCLEANRLLAELLPGTQRAGEAEVNRRRLEELDPYQAHVSPASPSADQVLAGAVTLERLDYREPGVTAAKAAEPQWASSLGVSISDSEEPQESLPEWLASPEESPAPAEAAEAVPAGKAEEEIPEWMQAAGWDAASPASQEATQPAEARSEIPAWLRAAAPEEEGSHLGAAAAGAAAFAASQSEKRPEEGQVEKLAPQPDEAGAEGGPIVPGAMAAAAADLSTPEAPAGAAGTVQPTEATPEKHMEPAGEPLPDWLTSPAEESLGEPAEDELPDWLTAPEEQGPLADASPIAAASAAALFQEPEERPAGAAPQSVSEWLQGGQAEAAAEAGPESAAEETTPEGIPDWLAQLAPEEPAFEAILPPEEQPEGEVGPGLAQAQIPDWLREMEEALPAEPEAGAPPAIEAGAVESEAPSLGSASDEIPDWLKAAMAAEAVDELSDRPSPAEEEAEPGIILGDTRPVRVGPPEPDVSTEAEGTEEIQVTELPAAEAVLLEAEAAEAPESEPESAGAEVALGILIAEAARDEQPQGAAPDEAAGGEQAEIESGQPAAEEASGATAEEPTPGPEDEEAAMAWLESLAVRQGAAEDELLTAPEERPEEAPDWVLQSAEEEVAEAEEKPDWLGAAVAGAVAAELVKGHEEEGAEEAAAEAAESAPASEWIAEEPAGQPEEEMGAGVLAMGAAVGEAKADEAGAGEAEAQEAGLPDWLRDYEGEAAGPSAEAAALAIETQAGPPEIDREEAAAQAGTPLDINAASLSQLERVPGVGFILAQSIVTYRDVNGPFNSLDELKDIPGITPETAQDLRSWLAVEVVSEAAAPPASVPELAAAWQAVSAGDIDSAVEQYTQLMRQDRDLNEVIQEIQQALVVHPLDPLLYQTLGDAYLRADRLQEALDAYNRAEDLLK